MAGASLELVEISKRYPGVQALDRVSFECRAGEIHAALGENGSGKSTLLGIASGAVVPDGGTIQIMGKRLSAADPLLARSLGLATVYQDDSLVRELTVAENLLLGARDAPVSVAGRRAFAEKQLAPHDLGFSADAMVGGLTPAQRQFLEIVKALVSEPKVLLLDEPTSSLDLAGVEKLSGIIRRVTAMGTAVVYVSHRLPEILALADRVTILRDGVGRGTYDIDGSLSEHDLIRLMVGRPIEAEYPAKGGSSGEVALWTSRLTGARFRDVSLYVQRGEVLGFAGAEGNGQRDVIRALGGIEPSTGELFIGGEPARVGSPREALAAGILSLSADRHHESIFPPLGVRENMTVQVLDSFASGGFVSASRERGRATELVDQLGIVTATLDKPIAGLSGGNQQKAVLARSFLHGAEVVLIDEPTQGVDANARFDIYRAIRERVGEGVACVINASDALELAGICDRVLVFSRGAVIRELSGAELTEENIVGSFLTSKDTRVAERATAAAPPSLWRRIRHSASGTNQWWVPLAFLVALVALVGAYATSQSDVFLSGLNIQHILLATAPLALVTMAQFNVLMVRGFDISVGATMSLTVVLASYVMGEGMSVGGAIFGALVCVAAGSAVGIVNGTMVRKLGINPVITTIATLSVVQGLALYLRPSPFGVISPDVTGLLGARAGFIPIWCIVILALAILGDLWLYRSRGGLRLRAVGFREEAARRNGVRIDWVTFRAYLLSAVIATFAGFLLAEEVGVGAPTVGASYTLTSIAAAVLGGAALSGGRGSFVGALLGALFFTLTINVITLLGMVTAVGVIASGALTLLAVLLYSGWEPFAQIGRAIRAVFRPVRAAP